MKLTAFFLMIGFLQVSAESLAQNVTLSVTRLPLEKIFEQVERQTGYHFMYEVKDLEGTKRVTVSVSDMPVVKFLEVILKGQPLEYKLKLNNAVITRKAAAGSSGRHDKSETDLLMNNLPDPVKVLVTDAKGAPLSGASVTNKNTKVSALTDAEGLAIVHASINDIIEITFIGYEKLTYTVKDNAAPVLKMTPAVTRLEETIVKGYYSTTKILNTGNVSSVKAVDIERQPVSDPILTLQGRVPGLIITQTGGGMPGRMNTVRIRGQNSMVNGNDPLYIVDGIHFDSRTPSVASGSTAMPVTLGGPVSPFDYLTPGDIESIEVLKDGDATAIYGSRGANGVIIITTKKGKSGKPQLDINVYTGFSKPKKYLTLMNTEQYLAMRRKAFENDGVTPTAANAPDLMLWDQHAYTDWFKELFGNQGKVTEASASLTGGSASTTFRVSGSYRDQGVIFPGNFYAKRIGANFSVNHKAAGDRLTMMFTTSYSDNFNSLPETGAGAAFTSYLRLAPNAPKLFNADGTINWANGTFNNNPMGALEVKAKENSNNLISSLTIGYSILKNVEFKTTMSYNATNFKQTNLYPSTRLSPFANNPNVVILRRHAFTTNQRSSWELEPQLNYKSNIWGGDFEVLVGTTFLHNKYETLGLFASGYENDELIKNFGGGSNIEKMAPATSNGVYKYNAFYARVGYNYKATYVLNITGRRDGSSRFGNATKFGNFGSVGAAWIFSNENAFRKKLSFLSLGKLRASYAVTGNDQLGDYEYLDTYTNVRAPYQGVTGLMPEKLTNPNFGWEKVNKMEIGLELGFFQNRINLSASFYQNRTSNQLVLYTLPEATGFKNVRANLPAILENKGLEIVLNTINLHTPSLDWSTSFNFSLPKNTLVSFENFEKSSYANAYTLGMPVSTRKYYHYTGKDANNLYTFQDVNKDNVINSTFDRLPVYIGGVYDGGIQNNVKYKGFELDFLWVFAKQTGFKNDQTSVAGLFADGKGNVVFREDGDYGLPFSQGSTYTSLQSLMSQSDGYVVDASYLSLKNLSVSYSFSKLASLKLPIRSATVYAQGQNLLTLSKYEGFDPEIPNIGLSPVIPISRTITIGVRMSF